MFIGRKRPKTRGDTSRNLAAARGVRTVVKSKSMVTEEIDLTHTLEETGRDAFSRPTWAS